MSENISFDAEGQARWGQRAAGLLIEREDNGKFMLTLRSAEVMDPGVWGIPGGRVEPGETDIEAAFAEAEEELGPLPVIIPIKSFENRSGDFTYTTYHGVMPSWAAKKWKPKLNWENDDWKWFSLRKLPKNVHPGVLEVFEAIENA